MDGQRFDAIARGFAARLTRRRAVAGALGLAATAIGAGDAAAAVRPTCRAFGAGCNRSSQCCDGRCDTRRTTPRSRRNRCTCPEGVVRCGGACVDLQTNASHCGACGNSCSSFEICEDGECVCAFELGSDAHCSACGDACGANQRCCGARGCVDLGTDSDCTSCDDVCDVDAAGFAREFCNGAAGCQTACQAGADGFVTTDWPPITFVRPDVDNFSIWRYVNPANTDPGFPYAACQTSADCGDCPSSFWNGTASVPVRDCGCVMAFCYSWGGVETHYFNFYPDTIIPTDTYACAIFYDDPAY